MARFTENVDLPTPPLPLAIATIFFELILNLLLSLLFVLVFIGFNSYKSKINTCSNCGAISLGLSETCMNCGADLENINKKNQLDKKPSESTIDVKAEEIK